MATRSGSEPGRWLVGWRVSNDGPQPLVIEDAWIPHGRFRGDGRAHLARRVKAGESSLLELAVTSHEPPGAIVENAFLIVRVSSAGRAWRVFTRMQIDFDEYGTPRPQVKSISAQSV